MKALPTWMQQILAEVDAVPPTPAQTATPASPPAQVQQSGKPEAAWQADGMTLREAPGASAAAAVAGETASRLLEHRREEARDLLLDALLHLSGSAPGGRTFAEHRLELAIPSRRTGPALIGMAMGARNEEELSEAFARALAWTSGSFAYDIARDAFVALGVLAVRQGEKAADVLARATPWLEIGGSTSSGAFRAAAVSVTTPEEHARISAIATRWLPFNASAGDALRLLALRSQALGG